MALGHVGDQVVIAATSKLLAAMMLFLLLPLTPSNAAPARECGSAATGGHQQVAGESGTRGFEFEGEQAETQGSGACPSSESAVTYVYEPACSITRGLVCLSPPCGDGGEWQIQYPVVAGEVDRSDGHAVCIGGRLPPRIDSEVVLRAMREVEIPRSKLMVQPPGGKTLVNFDTIVSTRPASMQRRLSIAGIPVLVRVWASSFSWHFGDDSEPLSTTESGRRYERGLPMDSYITHQYTDANVTVHPRVDTTYSAEYSVDGQPFQPVIGTVTIDGAPVSLQVVEARPVLTGTR